ncbi:MAG: hypothetical protein WD398_02700 [Cyclobacteriaceae bacterium]
MRIPFYILFFLMVVATVPFSCGDGDNGENPQKSPEELAIESLTGESGSQVWTVGNGGSVSKDGVSKNAEFENFELRFISNNAANSYTTSSGQLLFDSSGSFSLQGNNLDIIVLTGTQPAANKEISFTKNQDNLRLEFNVPAPQNARVTALAGFYVFDLVAAE